MTSDALIYSYYFVGGALLLLVLLGIVVSANMPGLEKWSKRFFVASFSILVLSIAAYFVDLFIYTDPNLALVEKITAFFETFLPSLLMPLLTVYILYRCKVNWRKSALFYVVIALWAVLTILLGVAQFTDFIYYVTPDNQFVRGSWYSILIVPMIGLIIANIIGTIIYRKKLTKKNFIAFLVYLIPLMVVMTVHIFVSVFLFIIIAVSISALSMFAIILTDQVEQYMRQQHEIADQRASITVLQMRPHFIYNVMMSIYYLCEQDPKKAQQVTLDFTSYLRKNFNALAVAAPIPFTDELEHTRAYLAVEQAQFEDKLVVEYDTPNTMFRLPPLTLQPIVENAVKHGMDPDANEPLYILIKTVKTDFGDEIIVEDNGPGISNEDNGEPHIALKNIRERLFAIGADLTISPRKNGGTIVRIFLPGNLSQN